MKKNKCENEAWDTKGSVSIYIYYTLYKIFTKIHI